MVTSKSKSFPRYFFPDENAKTVREIDYELLKKSGFEAVIFDLDNTLALWGKEELETEALELLNQVDSLGLNVAVLSNSGKPEIKGFLSGLRFPHLFNAGKPKSRGFERMLDKLEVEAEESVMVGDQLFTDVLGANRLGMYTIMVDPLDPTREYRFTRLNRLGESLLLRLRDLYRFLRSLTR
ncbi:MAG: YqeG family HAD IIIA-type phosphatase [Candidatus Acetothermia bacterium]